MNHRRPVAPLPLTGPLEFIAMDILGPLYATGNRNQYVLTITYRYFKLSEAFTTRKKSSFYVASINFKI